MIDNMKWTELHEVKAILIYKKVNGDLNNKKAIQYELDKDDIFPKDKADSVQMKLANIRALDTGRGLSSVSRQLIKIWDKHKNTTIEDLETEVAKKSKE